MISLLENFMNDVQSENAYPICFANIVKKFRNQNMKVRPQGYQKNSIQSNNERWMDASFDQSSNISRIDQ